MIGANGDAMSMPPEEYRGADEGGACTSSKPVGKGTMFGRIAVLVGDGPIGGETLEHGQHWGETIQRCGGSDAEEDVMAEGQPEYIETSY